MSKKKKLTGKVLLKAKNVLDALVLNSSVSFFDLKLENGSQFRCYNNDASEYLKPEKGSKLRCFFMGEVNSSFPYLVVREDTKDYKIFYKE